MSNDAFIQQAKESSALLSESKILLQIADMGKSVIISMEDLEYFPKYLFRIKKLIESIKVSEFSWIMVDKDSGPILKENLGNLSRLNEADVINIIQKKFGDYQGHSFVVNNGMKFLYSFGEMNREIKICFEKTKSMQEELKMLKPVSSLNEVFEHFKVSCRHDKTYYDECFSHDKVIKKEIKEQELRNILMKYLQKNIMGEVSVEFCTDYINDEESVDIFLNDGTQCAIIEVKFSFEKKYYEGKSFYNIFKRIEDGIIQLDKYATHLAKDSRLVDYGYLYIFYIKDMEESKIEKKIDEKIITLKDTFSKNLLAIFEGVKTNNMKTRFSQC